MHSGCVRGENDRSKNGFTFPWGGFGTWFNRAAIERLVFPVRCGNSNNTSDSPRGMVGATGSSNHWRSPSWGPRFESLVCKRLAEDRMGETRYFRPGMTVSELGAHIGHASNCLHGDWVLGYLVNYYHLSARVPGLHGEGGVVPVRLWHTGGSASSQGLSEVTGCPRSVERPQCDGLRFGGHCNADKQRPWACDAMRSLVCHGIDGARMISLHRNRTLHQRTQRSSNG